MTYGASEDALGAELRKGTDNNDCRHELCDADVAGRVGDNETG